MSGTNLNSINKSVTTSGTAVSMGASIFVRTIQLKAHPDNTGVVYVGGSSVAAASELGYPLGTSEVWVNDGLYLSDIYIDSTADGDTVSGTYVE